MRAAFVLGMNTPMDRVGLRITPTASLAALPVGTPTSRLLGQRQLADRIRVSAQPLLLPTRPRHLHPPAAALAASAAAAPAQGLWAVMALTWQREPLALLMWGIAWVLAACLSTFLLAAIPTMLVSILFYFYG
jgi:hypothetical protein